MAEPTLKPTAAQTAAALDDSAVLLAECDAPIPAPWTTLLVASWARLSGILSAGTFADHDRDAALVLRLSRAGCNACMAGAKESGQPAIFPWMRASRAHIGAWTAIAVGWPNRRTARAALPLELANVTPADERPLADASAERYLAILLQDPLGLTWAMAQPALTAIPAGVFLAGA